MKNRYFHKEKNIVYLQFPYDKEILQSLHNISGRLWNGEAKYWTIEENITNRSLIGKLISVYDFENFDFKIRSNKLKTLKPFDQKKIENSLYNYTEDINELDLKFSPRSYQEFAINYALNKKKFINSDDVGLGKTAETVFAAELGFLFPFIVICPNCVKYHWQDFWRNTNPERNISVINAGKASKYNNWDADVVIINYDILGSKIMVENRKGELKADVTPKFEELLTTNFVGLALDEIHFVKNSKSIRAKMCRKIAKRCEYVWGLSGTLVLNRPIELVNPLTTIGRFNGLFGDWRKFVYKYCDAKVTQFGIDTKGYSNIDELNLLMRNSCYIRREKSEVLDFIPEVQSTIIKTDLSNRRKYSRAEDDFLEYMTSNYSAEKAEKAANAEHLVLRNELRKLCVEGKVKDLEEWLNNYKDNTEDKLLVFGIHRDVLVNLAAKYKCPVINGGVKAEDKQKIVNKFKTSEDQFLFGNITACGTGVDGLQDSTKNMAFIELPDTDGAVQQTIGRIHRSGQKSKHIEVFYFLAKDSIDEVIMSMLDEKKKISDCINKGISPGKIKGFTEMLVEKFKNKSK